MGYRVHNFGFTTSLSTLYIQEREQKLGRFYYIYVQFKTMAKSHLIRIECKKSF